MEDNRYIHIPAEKFQLAAGKDYKHDKAPETKPIGYLKDAWLRFKRNKGSVVAAVIIILLLIFAIVAPILSPYTVSYSDPDMKYCYPKNKLSEVFGWDFWDGCVEKEYSAESFNYLYAIGLETPNAPVKNQKYTVVKKDGVESYKFRYNTYCRTGMIFMSVNDSEYAALQAYQDKTGIQVIYPITTNSLRPVAPQDKSNANYWYKTKSVKGKSESVRDEDGKLINIYTAYSGLNAENKPYDGYTSTVFEKDEAGKRLYNYSRMLQNGYEIRVDYYEYYIYKHTEIIKDGISEPMFLFGTTDFGKDIFTCVAAGARLSFIISIVVSVVNLLVGTIYGAIEGYYGGRTDLVMERISDILGSVPFMIVITLLKHHMGTSPQIIILFISFFLTGWIGMASRVRMQFYRFKNQEYVLAARTLGARDGRIMFKHIFPNSLGTIITGTVLVIPSFIFSEANLSFLGIINLSTGSLTSVGTILSSAQPYISTYPYMILSPALFISLLMLAFNLFGNGLRDAFNPSLRGTEG